MFIKKSKARCLVSRKVDKKIASILLNKFFDCLDCVEEDAAWWLFKIKDLVGKVLRGIYIWTKDKFIKVIGMLNRSEVEKKVFLRLANVERDEKEEKS